MASDRLNQVAVVVIATSFSYCNVLVCQVVLLMVVPII